MKDDSTLTIKRTHGTESIGNEMHEFITELFPFCRSLTGEGTLRTLQRIQSVLPITIHAIPTGTKVYDWTVPNEWNIKDAFIKDSSGRRIVDFKQSNLHVVSYSIPVKTRLGLDELRPHLHSLPDQPDVIPYRTTYYNSDWGFCLTQRQLEAMDEKEIYEVCIDATLKRGYMHYGEILVEGFSKEEVLISTHICHPSMCNDNLSGIAVATFLARHLLQMTTRYSYRFLFVPATIGTITWLSLNESRLHKIRHGLVAALLGNDAPFTYRRSRKGDTEIDQVVSYLLRDNNENRVLDFIPYGYDQRQFCSPGLDLPVGSLTRSLHGEFPEYHTSADNLDFVRPENLGGSLMLYQKIVSILERNHHYINISPKTEPQLGKRGLYQNIGGNTHKNEFQMALLWILNYSDGDHSVLDIAVRSGIPFDTLALAASRLFDANLLTIKQME